MLNRAIKDISGFERTEPSSILVVDDQPSLLQSLHALLRINGYRVELARSGGEAISRLGKETFQLVLLDLQMPGIDGLEVLHYIRENEFPLEVIVISGELTFESIKEALRNGAFDFIRKPYNPRDLLATVGRGLERHWQKQSMLRVEQSLSESERIHRFIVNSSPDFIYMLDAKGIFTYVNDRVEELLGYKRHELLGKHFSAIIHPHNADEIQSFFSEQRSGERAASGIEMRLLVNPDDERAPRHDNSEVIVELNAIGIYNGDDTQEKVFIGTLGSARDISERKRSEARISYQAYHDMLTRLPNRMLFDDRIKQAFAHARRSGQGFAVLFMDLDRFKLINDTLGHVMGDQVLQQVAERILGCLRAEDTLSRFGGDEFSLLLPDVSSREGVASVAEKILKAVRQPFSIQNHELYLSLSLGIAIYPSCGESKEELLQSADIAMYHVKAHGKDGYCFYSDAMHKDSEFLAVERELHNALDHQQFQVFFQPKVDPASHVIVGMEALLRWQHPERGLLYPEDFIAAAEKSRLIISIGDWVLRRVCEEIVRWQKQGLPRIKMSLNISSVQLEQDDFVQRFIRIVQEFGLAGDRFEIEITEQGLLREKHDIAGKLRALNNFGVSVAIDDFGRGYSSLSYLQNFPVNTLKIDRSFVREIEADRKRSSIVDGIAMMAKGMKLNVVAEGVENLLQLNYLLQLGCREVQGFLYGPAVPAADATVMLGQRTENGAHFALPH